jgi:hypothetical protein
MPRTPTVLLTLVTLGALAAPATVIAAGNPSGTGQPNQSCEAQRSAPAGFSTAGFANAQTHYAGSGSGSAHAGSTHAVSQYDVACFQVSQH